MCHVSYFIYNATVSRVHRAQTSIIFTAASFPSACVNAVLPCVRVRLRPQVIKIPLQRKTPPLPLSTWKTPLFSEKVCRKIGDVSLGYPTFFLVVWQRQFLGMRSLVRIWRKGFATAHRTRSVLVVFSHVVQKVQSQIKAVNGVVDKETLSPDSPQPSATSSDCRY